MKVVHLNTSDFGGAAMAAIQLHEALLDLGADSDLLTLNKTRDDVPRHHRVEPFELGGNAVANKLKYKARRAQEIAGVVEDRHNAPDNKNLQDRPPGHEIFTLPYSFFDVSQHPLVQAADVVHLHWVSYGMIDHATFFRNVPKPMVWTMHDMNPFTGGCHHADDCTGFTTDCGTCPQLKDPSKAHDYWKHKRSGMVDIPSDRLHLVAPSQWLAEKVSRSSIFQQRTCAVIPNGFSLDQFKFQAAARVRLGLPVDKKIILFNALDVANPRKGMQFLIPALRGMNRKDVLLVGVGGGSMAPIEDLEFRHVGFLSSQDEIALYYSAADLFVLPSLAENLPNTISESLLCGTPVVAFRTGGIPEQLDAGNGLLVDRMNIEDLRTGISDALNSTWDRGSIAAHAAARYDRKRIAKEYQRIYEGRA